MNAKEIKEIPTLDLTEVEVRKAAIYWLKEIAFQLAVMNERQAACVSNGDALRVRAYTQELE